jgi:Family of unknown function (DUF6232)/GYF domain 2
MSDVWYYEEEGKSVGPVPFEQLKSELLKRADWRDQFIWRAGASDWIKAGDLPELATTPPPLSPRQTPPPTPSAAKQPEPQKFLYKGPGVVITQTLAQFGNVTYPVNGIGSVRVDPPNRQTLIVGGVLIGLLGFAGLGGKSELAGILIIGAVICLIAAFRRPYRLMIKTASGDQQAFVSTKRQVLEEMKQAIEKAVVHRG